MRKLAALIVSALLLAGCGGAAGDADCYAIDHFYIAEEGDAFREAFDSLTVATYEWYRSVEGEEGVYILHYDHYSAELMHSWQEDGIYGTVPENGLSYLVVSPNYLDDNCFELSAEDRELAEAGVRLYLLPDSLDEDEAARTEAFLTDDALYGLDGGSLIDTEFTHDQRIEFRRYSFDGEFETFSAGTVADPVILVATCANMKFFESESLIATGVADGYIKLAREAYERYAHDLPPEMAERRVTFAGVGAMDR